MERQRKQLQYLDNIYQEMMHKGNPIELSPKKSQVRDRYREIVQL